MGLNFGDLPVTQTLWKYSPIKKLLRGIVNALWNIPNYVLYSDLQVPTVIEECTRVSMRYHQRLRK